MVVKEVMTKDPVSADVSSTVREVINTLSELDVRHVPIVDDGALVGIVSDRDIRGYLAPALFEPEAVGQAGERLKRRVSEIMNTDVISVTEETELSEVVDLMLDHRFGALPVVAPDSSLLVGIVSYMDVLRAAQSSL
jgi:acetoin utilization protein AcuB